MKVIDKFYRVNSVKNLSQISVALGHDRTRNELLPYILGKYNSWDIILKLLFNFLLMDIFLIGKWVIGITLAL